MARSNYYSCDRCGAKTFYDASDKFPDDIQVRALCSSCSRTHILIIIPLDSLEFYDDSILPDPMTLELPEMDLKLPEATTNDHKPLHTGWCAITEIGVCSCGAS